MKVNLTKNVPCIITDPKRLAFTPEVNAANQQKP